MNPNLEQPVDSQPKTWSILLVLLTLSLSLLTGAAFLTYYLVETPSSWVRTTSLFFFILSYFYSLLLYHGLSDMAATKRRKSTIGILVILCSLLYLLPGIVAPPIISHLVNQGVQFSEQFLAVFDAGFRVNQINRTIMIWLCIGFVFTSLLCYWKKVPAFILNTSKALSVLGFSLFFTYIHINFFNLIVLLVYSWL